MKNVLETDVERSRIIKVLGMQTKCFVMVIGESM